MNLNQILIDTKAVHINTEELFTWTSGIKSPIYCNNRLLISYPEYRNFIVSEFIKVIKTDFPETQILAGTATAGIPWAAFIAHEMNLPMIYIRSKAKGHGLKSALEGDFKPNQNTLIIEDLISTGKSSKTALDHAINDGLIVKGVLALFSYNLKKSKELLDLPVRTLATIDTLMMDESFSQAQKESVLSFRDGL